MNEQMILITNGNGYDEHADDLLIGEISQETLDYIRELETDIVINRETWEKHSVTSSGLDDKENTMLYRKYIESKEKLDKYLSTLGCKRIVLNELERISLH